jgi:hypothetical protein
VISQLKRVSLFKDQTMKQEQLARLGLREMDDEDCLGVNGGGFWDMLMREAIIHFDDIARGLEKGWNFDKKK